MNKFKVGDVVKRINDEAGDYPVGVVAKVIEIVNNRKIKTDFDGGDAVCYNHSNFELVKPLTKADLKDNHIVEFECGTQLVWEYDIKGCNEDDYFSEDLTDSSVNGDNYYGDIIKVYEFDKLVYDRNWFEDKVTDDKIEFLEEISVIGELSVEYPNNKELMDKINELVKAVNKLENK